MQDKSQYQDDTIQQIYTKINRLEVEFNQLKTSFKLYKLKSPNQEDLSFNKISSSKNNDLERKITSKILKHFASSIKERMHSSYAQLF